MSTARAFCTVCVGIRSGGVNRASCVCMQAVAALFAAPAAARSPWETGAGMGGMESTLPMPAPGSVIEHIAVPADNSCLSGYCANEDEHGFPMRTLQDEIALHAANPGHMLLASPRCLFHCIAYVFENERSLSQGARMRRCASNTHAGSTQCCCSCRRFPASVYVNSRRRTFSIGSWRTQF